MKKQIPLLMSTMMVEAILAGRKTITRRIVNPQPGSFLTVANWKKHVSHCPDHWTEDEHIKTFMSDKSPYGRPGDILWVRETWQPWLRGDGADGSVQLIKYAADSAELPFTWVKDYDDYRNRPGIHMNKEYARIWLEVTDIRVERLQGISEADAQAEGLACITKDGKLYKYGIPDKDGYPGVDDQGWPWQDWCITARGAFFKLWEKINGKESLEANPWCWVISFRVLSTTGKPAELEKEEAV